MSQDLLFLCKKCGLFNRVPFAGLPIRCTDCAQKLESYDGTVIREHVEYVKPPTPFTREDYIASLKRMLRHINANSEESPNLEEEIHYLESL